MINVISSLQKSFLKPSGKWLATLAVALIFSASNASAQATWNNFTGTGNDWNTASNWSTGVVPGVGVTANVGATDPGTAFTATYNSPMSAASIGALNLGWASTTGNTDTATLSINAAGFNTSSSTTDLINGLGILNVNNGGVFNAASTGGLTFGTFNGNYIATVNVATGASFTVSGTTQMFAGTLNISGGSTNLGVVNIQSSNSNDILAISGGTNTFGVITDLRDSAAQTTSTGIIVSGGTTTAAGVVLGRSSWGNMDVKGGTFTVSSSGSFIVGNDNGNNSRGASLVVASTGTLNDSDTTNGLIVGNFGSTTSPTSAPYSATFSGGTSNLGKITLIGTGVGANYASATATLSGGILYIGTGGIVTNATGTNSTSAFNLNGGTLAASGNWSSSMVMTLDSAGGTTATTIQTADSTAAAQNISLSGVLSQGTGTGGLIKTGTGTLTLSGANTYTGSTTISAGILKAANTPSAGTSATGTGNVSLGAATLTGTGSIAGTVTAANGASSVLTPSSTTAIGSLALGGLTSTSGLTLNMAIDGAGATNSGLTLGSGGFAAAGTTLTLNLYDLGTSSLVAGTIYNLVTGTGTWTAPTSISATLVASGYTLNTAYGTYGNGVSFNTSTNTVSFEVLAVPEPSTWALMIGGLALLVVIQRRKARQA